MRLLFHSSVIIAMATSFGCKDDAAAPSGGTGGVAGSGAGAGTGGGGTGGSVGPGPKFRQPEGVMLDGPSRTLVADSNLKAIVAVALPSGVRSILSNVDNGMGTASEGLVWGHPWALVSDGAGNAYVADPDLDGIISVDLKTGDRALLSRGPGSFLPPRGAGPDLEPEDLALDAPNSRLLVISPGRLVEVDLATGSRTILTSIEAGEIGNGPLQYAVGVAYDEATTRAFIVDRALPAILSVDLGSGNRTVFSGCDTLVLDGEGCAATDPIVASGPEFQGPRRADFDAAGGRLLVTDQKLRALFSVDLTTGNRTILSKEGVNGVGPPFGVPIDVVVDTANNRALVADEEPAVFAVDLTTGDRTVISSDKVPPPAR